MQAYCVSCRKNVDMVDAKEVLTKNKRHAMKGKCKICGTNVMRFIKK